MEAGDSDIMESVGGDAVRRKSDNGLISNRDVRCTCGDD